MNSVQRLVGEVPIFSSRMVASPVRRLSGESVDNESLRAQPIAAFCGVGNPESFFSQLRRAGYTPALTRAFADHNDYNQSDVDRLISEAKAHGAGALITTAKDALKLTSLNLELPCYVLEIKIAIADEDRLIKMIRNACTDDGR
jgi:tetraacyldisaccharide-1-P 4'-kinase